MTEGDFFSLRSVFFLLGRKIILHVNCYASTALGQRPVPHVPLSDMAKSLYAVVVNVSVAETG